MVEIISDFSACDFYDYNLDSKIYTHQLQCSHHSGQMRPFHSMRSMDPRTDQGSFGILTRSPHWTGIGTVVRINVYSIINAMFSRQINQPGSHFVIIRSKIVFCTDTHLLLGTVQIISDTSHIYHQKFIQIIRKGSSAIADFFMGRKTNIRGMSRCQRLLSHQCK